MDDTLESLIPPAVRPYVGWVVGMDWPEGDEEGLFRAQKAFETAKASIQGVKEDGDTAFTSVRETIDGIAAGEFGKYWKTFTETDPQYLAKLEEACDQAAAQLNALGLEVEYAKYMM